jgi:hypothetical protein
MEESHHAPIERINYNISHSAKIAPTSFSAATDPKIRHVSGPSNGASAAAHRMMGW